MITPEKFEIADGLAISRLPIDTEKLKRFRSGDDFLELIVELLKEVLSYACVAASVLGSTDKEVAAWDRDHAAVGGNMVRVYKLIHALFDQTCQKRGEVALLMMRLIFEGLVNIRFLIQQFSPEIIDSYVKYALQHEKNYVIKCRRTYRPAMGLSCQ
jgi:hypothetical protein